MPLFTAIGVGITAGAVTGAAATAVGLGTAALAGGAFALGRSGSKSVATPSDGGARIAGVSAATGALTEKEAQTAAKKRAFRSGVLFTSPTGLGSEPKTSSAKLR